MKSTSRAVADMLPEQELLLCCARVCMDSERGERILALIRQGIDWNYLIRIATHHNLLALLHSHLSATCASAVPKAIFNQLREYSHSNSTNSLLLTGELIKLQALFQSQDIPLVAFKGPILAACFYGSIGLRQFGDLDLLVRKQDVPRARDLLVSVGYIPRYRLNANHQRAMIEMRCEEPFDRKDDAALVDLHWAIIPARFSFAPDPALMWQRLERVSLNGLEVLSVSAEDLLMLLCVHGAKHAWERLSWICDLAELIRVRSAIDWELIIETASARRSQRMLFVGLLLINDLLGAPLPAEVLRKARADTKAKSLAAKVFANLFNMVGKQLSVFERDRFYFQTMTRISDRAQLWLDHIKPTPLEWQLLSLPRYLSVLYYPLRAVRVIARHSRDLLKRIFD